MVFEYYAQVDKEVDRLFAEQKYAETIDLLDSVKRRFPENLGEILWNEVVIYLVSGEREKSLTAIEEMLATGYFAKLDSRMFEPLRDEPRFQKALEECQRLRVEAQKNGRMKIEVYMPTDYNPTQKTPLFIALHGDGNALQYFKGNWPTSAILGKGYLLLYIQSSQVVSFDGFGWTPNYETTRKDIKAAYDEVISQYAVDVEDVLIGGFSGGAIASMEIAMAGTIPVKGFISLCPSLKPDSFTRENVKRAAKRGIRGVILEGEREGLVPVEQEMMNVFKEESLPFEFKVNANIGHAFPSDIEQKLLAAISFIEAS
jgi:predicted esterase